MTGLFLGPFLSCVSNSQKAAFPPETKRLRAEGGVPHIRAASRKAPITDPVIHQNLTKFQNFIKLEYAFESMGHHFDPCSALVDFYSFPAISLNSKEPVKALRW